jgi:hypothetical protein
VNPSLTRYYRFPADLLGCLGQPSGVASVHPGFFRFGTANICYGKCLSGVANDVADSVRCDAAEKVLRGNGIIQLPFDFDQVVDNLRLEHYRQNLPHGTEILAVSEPLRDLYYLVREHMPASIKRHLQKAYLSDWKKLPFPAWPVDFTVDNLHESLLKLLMETSGVERLPFIWFWPDGASSCLVMTHDVETSAGRDFTRQLMELDNSFGFKASFQVIPEKRYEVPGEYVDEIRGRGFEFNVHDLNHDGRLYQERNEFVRRAAKINGYVRQYNARGFRSGAMYRNQDWYDAFEFSYDMSVPNVAHLEPMRGGCCTVMPYCVGKILELPLTTTQDYSLFHILNDYSIELWKRQLALIRDRNGLMSFITHPDYLIDRRARSVYETLLDYLRKMVSREGIWAALPGDVDRWWRARNEMKLVPRGSDWEIVGPENHRARVAYAVLEGNCLRYDLGRDRSGENVAD